MSEAKLQNNIRIKASSHFTAPLNRLKFHSRQPSKESQDSKLEVVRIKSISRSTVGSPNKKKDKDNETGKNFHFSSSLSNLHQKKIELEQNFTSSHYENFKKKMLVMVKQDEALLNSKPLEMIPFESQPKEANFNLSIWKFYDEVVSLAESKPTYLKVAANTIVRVKVDSTKKRLPAMVEFAQASNDTEILLSLNKNPSPDNYDVKAKGNKILIPAKYQKDLTSQFSIRLAIIVKKTVFSELQVFFSHPTQKISFTPIVSRAALKDYSEYFSFNLNTPRPDAKKRMAGTFIQLNKMRQSCTSLAQTVSDKAVASQKLMKRIAEAQSKKEELAEIKTERLKENMDKFIKIQIERDIIVAKVLKEASRSAFSKAWTINIWMYRLLRLIKERYFALKFHKFVYQRIEKRISRIQRFWKQSRTFVYTRNEGIHENPDFIIVRKIMNMTCIVNRANIRQRSTEVVGRFLQKAKRPLKIRYHLFEKNLYYIGLVNRLKKHMRVKKELFSQFLQELEKAKNELSIMEKAQGHMFASAYYHLIEDEDKKVLFGFVFNYNLLGYLQNGLSKIKKCSPERFNYLLEHGSERTVGIQKIEEIDRMSKLRDFVYRHPSYQLFESTQRNLESGKYDNYLEMSEGRRNKLARRQTISIGKKQKSIEETRVALLQSLEKQEMKTILSNFLGPLDGQKLVLNYPKKFYMVLIYTMLEFQYGKQIILMSDLSK